VPGTYIAGEPVVTIAAFAPQLHVITSKQRPRKLTIHGSDGAEYVFLLKVGLSTYCVGCMLSVCQQQVLSRSWSHQYDCSAHSLPAQVSKCLGQCFSQGSMQRNWAGLYDVCECLSQGSMYQESSCLRSAYLSIWLVLDTCTKKTRYVWFLGCLISFMSQFYVAMRLGRVVWCLWLSVYKSGIQAVYTYTAASWHVNLF